MEVHALNLISFSDSDDNHDPPQSILPATPKSKGKNRATYRRTSSPEEIIDWSISEDDHDLQKA
jgi:hypothetical protein